MPEIKFETSKLQHEYKYAGDFGIVGNWNKTKAAEYQQAKGSIYVEFDVSSKYYQDALEWVKKFLGIME